MIETLQWFDGAVLIWIQEHLRQVCLNTPMMVYTTLANHGELWIVVSLILLCFRQTRKTGMMALLSMGLGALITNITIKPLVCRIRPYEVIENLTPLLTSDDPFSFPSGHTCVSFSAAVVLCRRLPEKWMKATAISLAVLMGFSRLYIGVHYPSDVLAGVLIGSFCALIICKIEEKITPLRDNNKN